jgi:iron complex outermembrane receptor protein
MTDRAGANLKWDIDDTFTVRAAYRYQKDERSLVNANNWIEPGGTYDQYLSKWAPNIYTNQGGYMFVDAKFKTASVEHKLTAGYSAYTYGYQMHQDNAANTYFTGLTFDDPYRSEPVWSAYGTKAMYSPLSMAFKNWIIGDDIKFNEKWSAMVGMNHTVIQDSSTYVGWDPSRYDKSANTPTVSLIYKPAAWISTYATYMESLEEGTMVGDGYTNAGAILEPMVSKQYEVGAKATVGGMLFTAALFQIDKANQYSNNASPISTYVQDGREIHKGIELTASGKVSDHLTLLGGVTLMDNYVDKTNDPTLVDKNPTDVANHMAKIYAEYSFPSVKGLTLNGGVYWIGKQFGNSLNTDVIPAYAVGDIGLRYETTMHGTPVIYRLNVTNITNKSYWSNSSQIGEPRTVVFSSQFKF